MVADPGTGAPGPDRPGGRLPSLLDPPVGFAHRGARALERENTVAAFELALRLGATGVETDAWLTADGVAVLDHDGRFGPRVRRREVRRLRRADLPAHVPTVEDLFGAVGPDVPVSIDVKDPAAARPVLDAALAAGADLSGLYLCSGDVDELVAWGRLDARARLVDSTRLRHLRPGPERYVAGLAERGVHVLNMHCTDWSGGLVALCHRFGLLAFGWDAQHDRQIRELLRMGCDGVYSDHPDRLADALRTG
jgi:glycerophosphoryl diester phosphodiesterase